MRPPVPEPKPALFVRVVPVRTAEVAPRIPVSGTVMPSQFSRVASGAPGIVTAFAFREGQLVPAGAVLAELRSETMKIELAGAQALLRQRQQELAEIEAGFRAEEIAAADAHLQAAQAQADFAELRAKRAEDLHQRKAVSDEQFDEARFEAVRLRQDALAAAADRDLKHRGNRPELVAAARAAAEAQAEAVRGLEDELGKRTIRAPFAGFLVQEETEIGQWVPEGGTVATLARLDQLEVRVNVEENAIRHVHVGDTVEVFIESSGTQALAGTVAAIVPRSQWQTGSRSFPVVIRVENRFQGDEPLLKEGMLARLTFRGRAETALLVHKDSIVRNTEGSLVYLLGDDGRVRPVRIEEGPAEGEYVTARGPLADGDRLVSEGVERVRPFDRVQLAPAPGPPTGVTATPTTHRSVR